MGLFDLFLAANDASRRDRLRGGPWTCVCGKRNRAKDLRCWDGGCGRTRQDGAAMERTEEFRARLRAGGWVEEDWGRFLERMRSAEWRAGVRERFLAWCRTEQVYTEEELAWDDETDQPVNDDVHTAWWGFSSALALADARRS